MEKTGKENSINPRIVITTSGAHHEVAVEKEGYEAPNILEYLSSKHHCVDQ
jgi:hypothetical protein